MTLTPETPAAPASADQTHTGEIARAVALVSVQDACIAVTQACAELARRGCLILSAHAVPQRPRVRVCEPPQRAGLVAGAKRSDCYRTVMATDLDGVQVEWCIPTRRRRGAATGA